MAKRKKGTSKLKKYIERLRVKEISLMVGFPLVGVAFAADRISWPVATRVLVFAAGVFFHGMSVYASNSYFGYAKDLENVRHSYIRKMPKKLYLTWSIFFFCLALVVYSFLDLTLVALALVSVVIWLVYSLPRIGLKHFPLAGTTLHFFSEVLLFQMGFILLSPPSKYSFLISFYFSFLFAGGHFHHELIDYKADKKAGIRTGAVFLGRETASKLCLTVFIASGVYWILLFAFDTIRLWEFLPFYAAFLLHVGTMAYIQSKGKKQFDYLFLNRRLYRIYYLTGGLSYCAIKYAHVST